MIHFLSSLDQPSKEITGFGGGTIALTESTPQVNFSSPLYNVPLTGSGSTEAWTYVITSPTEMQVQLTFLDINTTSNEMITVYDRAVSEYSSSSYSTYRVFYVYGNTHSPATVYSYSRVLTLLYDNDEYLNGGRGFMATVSIFGMIMSHHYFIKQ